MVSASRPVLATSPRCFFLTFLREARDGAELQFAPLPCPAVPRVQLKLGEGLAVVCRAPGRHPTPWHAAWLAHRSCREGRLGGHTCLAATTSPRQGLCQPSAGRAPRGAFALPAPQCGRALSSCGCKRGNDVRPLPRPAGPSLVSPCTLQFCTSKTLAEFKAHTHRGAQ